jgi:hypothetical protein
MPIEYSDDLLRQIEEFEFQRSVNRYTPSVKDDPQLSNLLGMLKNTKRFDETRSSLVEAVRQQLLGNGLKRKIGQDFMPPFTDNRI